MESKTKRHKPQHITIESSSHESDNDDHDSDLLPGLPNHIARFCLSRANPKELYSVTRSWRRLIYSTSFPPFLSLYVILASDPSIQIFSLDPFSAWQPLPPPPGDPPLCFIHRHPSFLARKLPIQSISVASQLVLLAATCHGLVPALTSPLIFDPARRKWRHGPALAEPRRWCAAGAVEGSVYVASGVGKVYKGDVARSVDRWRIGSDTGWENLAALRDGRFCREAVEAVELEGKLCMVNVKGGGPKEGAVYDVASGGWSAMAVGMLSGWNGPVAGAGDGILYSVDERRGVLSRYIGREDRWQDVVEASELEGVEQMAATRERVCAVCGGGERIVIVDVAAQPPRVSAVEPPLPLPIVAVHILPRMSNAY